MLSKARINLSNYGHISYKLCDNNNLKSLKEKADIILQGWSFGHTVHDGREKLEQTVDHLVSSCRHLLDPGGTIIFIETLGTNRKEAAAPSPELKEYYDLLENRYGFSPITVSTDYRFPSGKEAEKIMRFFFEDQLGQIDFIAPGVVREYTGIR